MPSRALLSNDYYAAWHSLALVRQIILASRQSAMSVMNYYSRACYALCYTRGKGQLREAVTFSRHCATTFLTS